MSGEKFQSDPRILLTFVGIFVTLDSNKHFASNFADSAVLKIWILVENVEYFSRH